MIGEQYLGMTPEEMMEEMTLDDIKYAILYEKNITALEEKLHSEENLEEIAKQALMAAVEFYDGDWSGIIEGDLAFESWCPVLWYDRRTNGMTETHFREIEETHKLDRWIEALHENKPMSIADTSIYKELNPVEYEIYERCHAQSLIAVPYKTNPVGFLIVRNPKRFLDKSSFLQALAYVVFTTVSERKLLETTKRAFSPDAINSENDIIINLLGGIEIYTSKGHMDQMEIGSQLLCRTIAYYVLNNNKPASSLQVYEAVKEGEINYDTGVSFMKSQNQRMKKTLGPIMNYPLFTSTKLGFMINPELNIISDVKMFDQYWKEAQGTVTSQTKIELYGRALELYKGKLLADDTAEDSFMQHQLHYRNKCVRMYSEIMKLYFDTLNYSSVIHYANKALEVEPANVDAYFWMSRAFYRQEQRTAIKVEMEKAKSVLTEEEYEDLVYRLKNLKEI